MEAADLLEARKLRKPFGRVKAVDGRDFSLKRGRTLAVVGESGCGKTTTAKLILRLEQPSSGQVLVDGEDVHTLQGGGLRPAGCRFHPRCPAKLGPICEPSVPAIRTGGATRQTVSCHLYPE